MLTKDNKIFEKLNAEAFEAIYFHYSKKVYRICLSYTQNTELSQEMTQDIFTSLWERKDELVITESYEKYLTKAAKFQVFQYFRKKAVEMKYQQRIEVELCNVSNCTENQIFYDSLTDEVTQIMDRLPCRCREVFEMSRTKGMTNSQIASSLLISVKTVEKHLTKALSVFRKSLKEFQH